MRTNPNARSRTVNPRYQRRLTQQDWPALRRGAIGPLRLHQGDCLKILPRLAAVDAVVTDPPFASALPPAATTMPGQLVTMRRLVPEMGTCFLWQSPLRAGVASLLPKGWRIIAACKQYPEQLPGRASLSFLGTRDPANSQGHPARGASTPHTRGIMRMGGLKAALWPFTGLARARPADDRSRPPPRARPWGGYAAAVPALFTPPEQRSGLARKPLAVPL